MSDGSTAYQPFAPRAHALLRVAAVGGFRLRVHAVAFAPPLDEARFAEGMALAKAALPAPAVADGRPGVGFVVLHQGRGADYVVLAWWDQENELPVRVFVQRDGAPWRPARGGESFCVWDLAIVAAERDAYVRCLLTPGGGGLDAYLASP